jgi:hypothetical protein
MMITAAIDSESGQLSVRPRPGPATAAARTLSVTVGIPVTYQLSDLKLLSLPLSSTASLRLDDSQVGWIKKNL